MPGRGHCVDDGRRAHGYHGDVMRMGSLGRRRNDDRGVVGGGGGTGRGRRLRRIKKLKKGIPEFIELWKKSASCAGRGPNQKGKTHKHTGK